MRAFLGLTLVLAACSSSSGGVFVPATHGAQSGTFLAADAPRSTPISHVVIVVQENRTPDYLFQGLPNADIATSAIDSQGRRVPLHAVSLGERYDLGHGHEDFVKDYDGGRMDGFDARMSPRDRLRPFGYAPENEAAPYHAMARQYVFADHMFQSNEGPSFPSHLYLISGTASDEVLKPYLIAENPVHHGHDRLLGGCDSPQGTIVDTIDPQNGAAGPTPFPCFDRSVLTDFLEAKGVSWRYYQEGRGAALWHAFDAIKHVRYGSDYANVVSPPQTVLEDIRGGRLAGVSWVIPAQPWSDHAGPHAGAKGPAWVAAVVNAIGESKYWPSTAIFILWDDWGGWYDHVAPPIDNYYELGFRVPLIVVSPYAKRGYVSKQQHEFGSILAFTEKTFGIPKGSLQTTDVRADELSDAFDFTQKARAFTRIPAPPFTPAGPADAGLDDEDP